MRYARLQRVNLKNMEYAHAFPRFILHFAKNLPTYFTIIHCIFTHFLLLQVTENNMHGQEEFKKNVEEILSFLDIKF